MTETPNEPDSDDTQVSVGDEDLPEDLRPTGDNPLAQAADQPDAERQVLGDPHIDPLQRDADDQPVAPDTDASEDAHHGEDSDADEPVGDH